jgi:dihydroorotate dehydrogenase
MLAAGGIMTGHDIYQAMSRGASAVQIYTAMIYRGPFVVWKMLLELQSELQLRGITHVEDVVGSYYA